MVSVLEDHTSGRELLLVQLPLLLVKCRPHIFCHGHQDFISQPCISNTMRQTFQMITSSKAKSRFMTG